MTCEGKIKYKRALVLTSERIKELENIILKYSESVTYEGMTIIDTKIMFTSKDELINHDNFRNHRLKSLTVIGHDKGKQIIICAFEVGGFGFFVGYGETCTCRYNVTSVELETNLRSDIETFLEKVSPNYWLIGKLRVLGLVVIACLYFTIYNTSFGEGNKGASTNMSGTMGVLVITCAFLIVLGIFAIPYFIDQMILEKLFPPIVFAWGEEKLVYERWSQRRKNIFWGVIVAILVGIFVFCLTNLL